jgi:hypothetical protein
MGSREAVEGERARDAAAARRLNAVRDEHKQLVVGKKVVINPEWIRSIDSSAADRVAVGCARFLHDGNR